MLLVVACAPAPTVPPSVAPATQAPSPTTSPSIAPSPGSATLIVTQAFVGEGWYTEGAYAYVELSDPSGVVVERAETTEYHLEQEVARFTVEEGSYQLRSYVRSCNGACQALSPPSEACDAAIELKPRDELTIRIERTLRGCEVRSL